MGSNEAIGADAAAVDPLKINQHVIGPPDQPRVMTDTEIAEQLGDPFAVGVLRRGVFPSTLDELFAALDTGAPELTRQESYLIAEGGQIRFQQDLDKGGSRLLIARFVAGTGAAELMISVLLPPGTSPRRDDILIEVLAWDPQNRTFHYYQRQQGAWFWCGQSDMALEEPTRGHGPFDSHVNGYPLMKELKTPWVHWHGPGRGIAETAFAPDDPLVRDPLFTEKDHALNFEVQVMRPMCERWNTARFDKLVAADASAVTPVLRQVVETTIVNLISTHKEWSRIGEDGDLDDISPTFFFDQDCFAELGVAPTVPALRLGRDRYAELVAKYDLRVRGQGVDLAGDVPFCFTVPERAFEDVLVVRELVRRQLLSDRFAACLLMVDFPNPLFSTRRSSLLGLLPATADLAAGPHPLDTLAVPSIEAAAPENTGAEEFMAGWRLGEAWRSAFTERLTQFMAAVAAQLATDEGSDAIFRLAESRRREFRRRPLAEFDLSLPIAVAITGDAPPLEMAQDTTVREKNAADEAANTTVNDVSGPDQPADGAVTENEPSEIPEIGSTDATDSPDEPKQTLEQFVPPGRTPDLTDTGATAWSLHVQTLIEEGAAGDPTTPADSPRPQFFNPIGVAFGADTAARDLTWGAFPRKLARRPVPERWRLGEVRAAQEEYCEWATQTDGEGRIVRVHFTTEFGAYFHLLAQDNPDQLVAVYSEAVGEPVPKEDLVRPDGTYRPENPWNLLGALHMIQQNNTLAAAVLLVAQSTILREGNDGILTDANDLIRCGIAADADRNSDPMLVTEVNALARAGALVTFADPVGIYINRFRSDGIVTPDGTDPQSFWRITRGAPDMGLHAVFEVPAEAGFTMSELTLSGVPLTSASQLAERIDVKVSAVAHETGIHKAKVRPCGGGGGTLESIGATAALSVRDLVRRSALTR